MNNRNTTYNSSTNVLHYQALNHQLFVIKLSFKKIKETNMKLLKPCAMTLMIGLTSLVLSTSAHAISKKQFLQSYSKASNVKTKHIPLIYQAEKNATPAGKAVLRQARIMALDKRRIVKGSCWDYLNAVFNKAGVKRKTIFKQKKNGGKYININKLQAGDWVYHINYSYHNVEHSGMFVAWVDKAKSKALMLSYAGENRREPARYKVYDLRSTYNVMRPQLKNSAYKKSASKSTSKKSVAKKSSYKKAVVKKTVAKKPIAKKPSAIDVAKARVIVQGVNIEESKVTDPYYIEKKPFHIPTVEAVKELQPKMIEMPTVEEVKAKAVVKAVKEVQPKVVKMPATASSESEILDRPVTAENTESVKEKDLADFKKYYANAKNVKYKYLPMMYLAEQQASPAGQKVLGLGRVMTLDRREILQGTSRNYVNAIFVRTGVDRETVFEGSYPQGPFINSADIELGDWVSFINHSYKNVEHNGVFVGWVNKAKKRALILSYPGEGSRRPARYRVYDISHVYEVKRPLL